MKAYYEHGGVTLYCGDALEVMRGLEAGSVGLVAVDPPYYRVKEVGWDRQWAGVGEYLDWLRALCREWRRVLKVNGSLYVFASPQMAAQVECVVGEFFNVLNHIVWLKGDAQGNGQHSKARKGDLRGYFPRTERVIFAEHCNAEGAAKGEAGYVAACDDLRGAVFEPLRAYLVGEKERAGVTSKEVDEYLGNYMSGHYFGVSQWALPTREAYERLRELFNTYEPGEFLCREYEDLRREYEDLRRPFAVSGEGIFTDVWEFETVMPYNGKHMAEKPLELMKHIVATSSRAGDVVLDCCAGHGTTLEAAQNLGRRAVGVEKSARWCEAIVGRLAQMALFAEAV